MKVYSNLTAHNFPFPIHMAPTVPLSRTAARVISCPTLLSRQAGNKLPCLSQIPTSTSSPAQTFRFRHESRHSMPHQHHLASAAYILPGLLYADQHVIPQTAPAPTSAPLSTTRNGPPRPPPRTQTSSPPAPKAKHRRSSGSAAPTLVCLRRRSWA